MKATFDHFTDLWPAHIRVKLHSAGSPESITQGYRLPSPTTGHRHKGVASVFKSISENCHMDHGREV